MQFLPVSDDVAVGLESKSAFAQAIRKVVLRQSKRAHVGHIGSALSIADMIAVLYEQVLSLRNPDDEDRDRFILSKGHAALALYAALHPRGYITAEQLDMYCSDGSLLGVHPERTCAAGRGFRYGIVWHGALDGCRCGACSSPPRMATARSANELESASVTDARVLT